MFEPGLLPLWSLYRPPSSSVRALLSGLPLQVQDVLGELMTFGSYEDWELRAYKGGQVVRKRFPREQHGHAGVWAVEYDELGWNLVGRIGAIH